VVKNGNKTIAESFGNYIAGFIYTPRYTRIPHNRLIENCMGLITCYIEKARNSTVSKCACVRRLAIVKLLLLLECFRRGCLPTEMEGNK